MHVYFSTISCTRSSWVRAKHLGPILLLVDEREGVHVHVLLFVRSQSYQLLDVGPHDHIRVLSTVVLCMEYDCNNQYQSIRQVNNDNNKKNRQQAETTLTRSGQVGLTLDNM